MKVRLFILAVLLGGALGFLCTAGEVWAWCNSTPDWTTWACYCRAPNPGEDTYQWCQRANAGDDAGCTLGPSCGRRPASGGGGGNVPGERFVNLDDGSPCETTNSAYWCPPECAQCW